MVFVIATGAAVAVTEVVPISQGLGGETIYKLDVQYGEQSALLVVV
jgi:hypothetical protein